MNGMSEDELIKEIKKSHGKVNREEIKQKLGLTWRRYYYLLGKAGLKMGVYRSSEITTVRSDVRAQTLITSVPASILRRFGCKKGDRLKWDVKEDIIVAKKIEEK